MPMIDVTNYPGSQSVVGRILRAPLRLIPKRAVVPILQGPLRGRRWIVGSGISRLWLGSYEPEKMDVAKSLLKKGDVAFDIGANVGIYTLLFSSVVGSSGKVVAFEPWKPNLAYLRKHLLLNDIANVVVLDSAVSEKSGWALLDGSNDPCTVKISTEGSSEIRTVRLDDYTHATGLRPNLIKIDVEGAELSVLKGALRTLKHCAPVLLIATHSPDLKTDCIRFLENHGYHVDELGSAAPADEIMARPKFNADNKAL